VEDRSQAESASYTIFKEGSFYFAKNGTTGSIDYSGTNASQVIQNAGDALTSGRIWKEKILIKDDITITHTIVLSDYVTLQNDGKLTLDDNTDTDLISVEGSHVEIIGGTFDGNNGAQSVSEKYTIKIAGVVDVIVRLAYIHNSYDDAIFVSGSSDVNILYNSLVNCGDAAVNSSDGIDFNSVNHSKIVGNYILSPIDDGIDIEKTNHVIISGNTIKNVSVGIEANDCTSLTISENSIQDTVNYGIWLGTQSLHNIVTGNYITNSTNDGIVMGNGSNGTITCNYIFENGRHGISLTTNQHYTLLSGNYVHNMTSNGVNISNSNYTLVVGNQIRECAKGVAEAGTSDYTLLDGNVLADNVAAHDVDATNSVVGDNVT